MNKNLTKKERVLNTIHQSSKNRLIMGIVNVTPDSFSDGGRYLTAEKAVDHALNLVAEGADWIDLGAESSRPGSDPVSAQEESDRLLPVIEGILRENPEIILSIDTTKASTANQAVQAGASIINDISAGLADSDMFSMISQHDVPVILMHMQGNPKTMQENPVYHDVTLQVTSFLKTRADAAASAGIQTVLVDPGFGFGKTLHHNYELLANLQTVCALGIPVVAGLSRKSMIGKITCEPPDERILGSKILETVAWMKGASIFRVHDVRQTVIMRQLLQQLDIPA